MDVKCPSCKGTGVYVGVCERDGFGVVCHTCNGSGMMHYEYTYEEIESRKRNKKVKWILETTVGICAGLKGKDKTFSYEDFGGMSYDEWFKGKSFPSKSEMRNFVCPAWWYQAVDYDKKPDWKECHSSWGGGFSSCDFFEEKEKCWEKWDKQYGNN